MQSNQRDELLKRLGTAARDGEGDDLLLDVGELRAFRAGTLAPERQAALEKVLSTSAAAREQLLCLDQELPRLSPARVDAIVRETAPRRAPARGWVGAAAAAAAALLLSFRLLGPAGPAQQLPPLALELQGGTMDVRSADPVPTATLPTYASGSVLQLVIHPVQGRLTASPVLVFYLGTSEDTFKRVEASRSSWDSELGEGVWEFDPAALTHSIPGHYRLRAVAFSNVGEAPQTIGEHVAGAIQVLDREFKYLGP